MSRCRNDQDRDASHPSEPAFLLAGELDRVACPRLRFEADLADRLACALADSVTAILDLRQRLVDLAEDDAFLLDEAERELLFVVVRAHVRHVQRKVREVAAART